MKTLIALLALLALPSCKDKDKAGDWAKAEPTPLQARLAEKRMARVAMDSPEAKSDAVLLRLEATTMVAQIATAFESLAKGMKTLDDLERDAGASSNPVILKGIENLRANEAAMFAEAEKLEKTLDQYRAHVADPELVDRMKEHFQAMKAASRH